MGIVVGGWVGGGNWHVLGRGGSKHVEGSRRWHEVEGKVRLCEAVLCNKGPASK